MISEDDHDVLRRRRPILAIGKKHSKLGGTRRINGWGYWSILCGAKRSALAPSHRNNSGRRLHSFPSCSVGGRVVFDPEALAWDNFTPGPKQEFRRKVRTLTGNYQLLQLAPWVLTRPNPLRLRFICHKLLRLFVPFALLGCLVSTLWIRQGMYELALVFQVVFYALAMLTIVACEGWFLVAAVDYLARVYPAEHGSRCRTCLFRFRQEGIMGTIKTMSERPGDSDDAGGTDSMPSQPPRSRRKPLVGAYVTLLLSMFIYFARPEDWIPGLSNVPLAKITGILALFALVFSLRHIRHRPPREVIFLFCLIVQLFLAAISPVWRGGAFETTLDFAKVLIVVVVMIVAVNTPEDCAYSSASKRRRLRQSPQWPSGKEIWSPDDWKECSVGTMLTQMIWRSRSLSHFPCAWHYRS